MISFAVRDSCCICGNKNLIEKLTIVQFPVYMGVTLEGGDKDRFFDQVWVECSDCGCIQLLNLLPLSEIYKTNHHTEVVGGIWKEHHDAFSDYISSSAPKNVLEIGAAHGYLATTIVKKFDDIKYTIVEPDSNLIDPRIRVIKGFIEDNLSELKNSDCIVHSHVLEHVYNPIDFINAISNNIKLGTSMFISFPNMDGLIKSGGLNSLNFEHSYLLDPAHAEQIFKKSGFSIKSSKKYLSHSYFYHLIKETDALNIKPDYPNINRLSQEFLQMVLSLKKFVQYSMKILETSSSPVFIFGAHVFSQSLFSFGMNSQKIEGILDNSKEKQGKRLYGTQLLVMNPSVISEVNEPVVVLHASHYQNEIRKQLFDLNPTVRIIENFAS